MKIEKVLVCITIQENSKRLIDKGAGIAQQLNAQLHIVHIEHGMSVFSNPDAIELLEELFDYGKASGGEVHFISDNNIPKCIATMVDEMAITRVVLGETMRSKLHQLLEPNIHSYIRNKHKAYEVLVIARRDKEEQGMRRLPNEFAF